MNEATLSWWQNTAKAEPGHRVFPPAIRRRATVAENQPRLDSGRPGGKAASQAEPDIGSGGLTRRSLPRVKSTSSLPPFSQPVSFTACSFLRPEDRVRRYLLRKSLPTWRNLLDLPFAERIFLDDRSPDSAATRLLEETGMAGRFDQVRYQDTPHPPHSNFGIVGAFELGTSPYLAHLDDDVSVTGSPEEIHAYIERALLILVRQPDILGINLLKLDRRLRGFQDWEAEEPCGAPGLYHPRKYFGTCACIIRRELLARGDFRQVLRWGENQPGNWEELVTRDPREFLVAPPGSPFLMSLGSFFFKSTAANPLPARLWHCLKQGWKTSFLPDHSRSR